jgi:uncharacterized phage-associated protein
MARFAPELSRVHVEHFLIGAEHIEGGRVSALEKREKESVDAVLRSFGKKSAHWLSEVTHREDPWRDARLGLESGERGAASISHAAMAACYRSLV